MTRNYADCYYCGGMVEEKLQIHEMRRGDQLILIENVPMGVCNQCGERYIMSDVAAQIDRMLKHPAQPEKTVEVPVYLFEQEVA